MASPDGTPISGFPLFPLGIVLLPREKTALHIFEPRYRDLTARCLSSGEPFGFVLDAGDGSPREFGCTARIVEVLERFEDGRLNIVVEGEKPFRLIESEDGFTYHAGKVETLADAPAGPGDAAQADATRVAFQALVAAVDADPIEAEELAGMDAFAMAARVSLEPEDKQALLETREEGDRLSILERVFAEAASQVAAARRMAGLAQGNGFSSNGHRPQ